MSSTPNQTAAATAEPSPEPGSVPQALLTDATTPAQSGFPIVGIGASAGGLAALEAFFSGMPTNADPGMAFLLVQHLSPDHESILTEIIQRYTRMKVSEVADGVQVQVNCVYIIAPNRDMAFINGSLQLLEPLQPRGHRLPIDFLFRSMAQDQHERAIAIVLSGTGSDGTLGVRAIKSEGGMVMVQTPESAEFDGMPRSALATGLVDYQLPPSDMPAQLIAYVTHAFGRPPCPATVLQPQSENAVKKIFILLRAQTGHDFSEYKPNTIFRRIERRMAVHQIASMDSYVRYLQHTPSEVQALFADLLIGVTNFFRDPEAFAALQAQVIPKLFENKRPGAQVRVWTAGCSSGEEAYSVAILLQEQMEALKTGVVLQVFATDIDSRAIATARAGVFPASIAADVPAAQLVRYFTLDPDGSCYRVNKVIRDMLVFSEQDVIKDPPFSKLDLIVCRNLLIYLGPELQKRLISLFHYALCPNGYLFLGSSESVSEYGDLFGTLDRKAKLYQRKAVFQGVQRTALQRALPLFADPALALPTLSGRLTTAAKHSLRELTEQSLLQLLAPVGALVNAQGDLLYLLGRAGLFLEPTPGEAGINNILKMAREGLRHDLTTALFKAIQSHGVVRQTGLRVKTNGHHSLVSLCVSPVVIGQAESQPSPLFLVVLEAMPEPLPAPAKPAPAATDDRDANTQITALNEELRAKEEYLHAANEELETSNEELKSSNEEMQSVNEELQSTNEELETSKEELQSVNEELNTVNTELQAKVAELSRINNDMNNLLAGTGIGTIFVDHALRIMRFTPSVTRIINLIQSDIGRPVAHIAGNMVGYDQLVPDVQSVLASLIPKEVTVQTTDGKYYTLRILPYRTLDNVIEGGVITFVDITDMVQARKALAASHDLARLAVVERDAFDAITVQGLDGQTLAWNPAAERMYGWKQDQALQMNVLQRVPKTLHTQVLAQMRQLCEAQTLAPFATQRLTQDGRLLDVTMIATALHDEAGHIYAIATTERCCNS